MVWGGISILGGKTDLVILEQGQSFTGEFYLDNVLANVGLKECVGKRGYVLVQDGARVHTANICKGYCAACNINCETQSPNSPDINPIEKIWAIMKRKVERKLP